MSVNNLLLFNGADLSQVFNDDGLTPSTWTIENGTPIISTDEFKFGGSGLKLDGLSNLLTTDFDLGDSANNSWTLEVWVWVDPTISNTSGTIINFDSNTLRGLQYTINGSKSFSWYDAGGRCYVDLEQTPIQDSQWYHVAVTNDNGLITLFCNGVSSRSKWRTTFDYTGHDVRIGKYGVGATMSAPWEGYIDCLRFTPNEVLYNALSTPINIPSSELTTTTVAPPIMSTDHVSILDLEPSDNPVGVFIGLADNHIVEGGSGSSGEPETNPTSTNVISGNVKKLGLPFGARVVVVSVGVTPIVVGAGTSDDTTGDYSIDVYPYTDECLIYVAPDYGNDFVIDGFVGVGTIIHPTVPNRNVYIAQNDGLVDSAEPTWPESGLINSGAVTFLTLPLHRPLMNGFIKPVVTPI